MLQFAFCIAHCHRSVTSAASGDHQPSFLGGKHFYLIILVSIGTVFFYSKWESGDWRITTFLAIYSFLFMQTLITIQTSSQFLFYYVSTRSNEQGTLMAPAGGTPVGARVIYQQSVCSPWSISVVTPTLEPHCQPANQAEPANRKITRESCNRAKPGRGDSDTRQSQSQWTLIINNHLQREKADTEHAVWKVPQ